MAWRVGKMLSTSHQKRRYVIRSLYLVRLPTTVRAIFSYVARHGQLLPNPYHINNQPMSANYHPTA